MQLPPRHITSYSHCTIVQEIPTNLNNRLDAIYHYMTVISIGSRPQFRMGIIVLRAWLPPLVGTSVDKACLGSHLVCLLGTTAEVTERRGEGSEWGGGEIRGEWEWWDKVDDYCGSEWGEGWGGSVNSSEQWRGIRTLRGTEGGWNVATR